MENGKKLSINYSKEVKDFIKNKQKVLDHLKEFQGFTPTDMIRVYHNDLNNFILDKMSTSLKISADVFVDDKKLEKWAKMCMALENMTKEEIEDIAVRHYVEKLENKMNNKLAKYERAFEILKEVLSLEKDTSLDEKVDFHTLYFTGELPYECYKRLTKEKYELLEEVLGNENS